MRRQCRRMASRNANRQVSWGSAAQRGQVEGGVGVVAAPRPKTTGALQWRLSRIIRESQRQRGFADPPGSARKMDAEHEPEACRRHHPCVSVKKCDKYSESNVTEPCFKSCSLAGAATLQARSAPFALMTFTLRFKLICRPHTLQCSAPPRRRGLRKIDAAAGCAKSAYAALGNTSQ